MIFYLDFFSSAYTSHLSRRQFTSHTVHLFGILPLWASPLLIPCFRLLQDITLLNRDPKCNRKASLRTWVSNPALGDRGFWLRRGHSGQREAQLSNHRTAVGCKGQTSKRNQSCPPGRSTDDFVLSNAELRGLCMFILEVE